MTGAARALQGFFGGFGWTAYARDSVPPGARPPYITYEIACPPPLGRAKIGVWVWDRGLDAARVAAKCDAIAQALAEGGAWAGGLHLSVSPGSAPRIEREEDVTVGRMEMSVRN